MRATNASTPAVVHFSKVTHPAASIKVDPSSSVMMSPSALVATGGLHGVRCKICVGRSAMRLFFVASEALSIAVVSAGDMGELRSVDWSGERSRAGAIVFSRDWTEAWEVDADG